MSTWIRQGTVSVTNGSNTIIGTGTSWDADSVRKGWQVEIEGEGQSLEIARYVSANEIELVETIERSTAAGLTFKIIPNQALNVEVLRSLNGLDGLITDLLRARGTANYQLWQDAGNQGTIADYIQSQVGPPGPVRALTTGTSAGAAQVIDFAQDIQVATLDAASVAFSTTGASAQDELTLILQGAHQASEIDYLRATGSQVPVGDVETVPGSVVFSPDGQKFILLGFGDQITQYHCPTPGRIAGAYPDGNVLDVSGFEASPTGGCWAPDGQAFFLCGQTSDRVYQIDCGIAGRITNGYTAYNGTNLNVQDDDDSPQGVVMSTAGTRLFVVGQQNSTIYEYALEFSGRLTGTPALSATLSIGGLDALPTDIALLPDGSALLMTGQTNQRLYLIALPTPNRLTGATITGAPSSDLSGEMTTPRGLSVFGEHVAIVDAGADAVVEYDRLGLPVEITLPAAFGGASLTPPAFGELRVYRLVTTDTGATIQVTGAGTALTQDAFDGATPAIGYSRRRFYVDEMLPEFPGASNLLRLQAALAAAGGAKGSEVILRHGVTVQTGGSTLDVPDGVDVIGEGGLIEHDAPGGAVFRNALRGGSYGVSGLMVNAMGNNGAAVFLGLGVRRFRCEANLVWNFSTSVMDVVTADTGETTQDVRVVGNIAHTPAVGVFHPFIARSGTDREFGERVTFLRNNCLGRAPNEAELPPGQYVDGTPDVWTADMFVVQGFSDIEVGHNTAQGSGAAGFSCGTRIARRLRFYGNVAELCRESINFGSGVFLVMLDDASTYDDEHIVSWGAGTSAQVLSKRQVGAQWELRLGSAGEGIPIGVYPELGDTLVSATPLPGSPGTVQEFRAALEDFEIHDNKAFDTGLKFDGVQDAGAFNFVYARRGGGKAMFSGNSYGAPRGLGRCTKLVSLSNSEAYVPGNTPSYAEAPDQYVAPGPSAAILGGDIAANRSLNAFAQADVTLNDDPAWVDVTDELTIPPGAIWQHETVVAFRTSTAAMIRFRFVVTGDVSGTYATTSNSRMYDFPAEHAPTGSTPSYDREQYYRGRIIGGANGGTVKLQMAQATQDASDTIVRAGSGIKLQRAAA